MGYGPGAASSSSFSLLALLVKKKESMALAQLPMALLSPVERKEKIESSGGDYPPILSTSIRERARATRKTIESPPLSLSLSAQISQERRRGNQPNRASLSEGDGHSSTTRHDEEEEEEEEQRFVRLRGPPVSE